MHEPFSEEELREMTAHLFVGDWHFGSVYFATNEDSLEAYCQRFTEDYIDTPCSHDFESAVSVCSSSTSEQIVAAMPVDTRQDFERMCDLCDDGYFGSYPTFLLQFRAV